MSIQNKIEADLKIALKSRDALKVSALRMVLSEIHNLEIKVQKFDLPDSDVLTILWQGVKKRKDSISQFRKGDREDLAAREEAEIKIIETYLPKAIAVSELEGLVKAAVVEASMSGAVANIGAVMKIVMPKVKGQADGATISDLVKKEFSKQT
ncbi:MAG: GatB/YqeY domain-containing protein [bacterium]|nr:GatB/YqeY domain-containing protein [bacterium]